MRRRFGTCSPELYAKLDDEPDFAAMIDTLGYGRDDRRLLELAERSYEVMRCKVDPEAWMADCLRAYALPEGTPAEQTLWGAHYLKARRDALESADAMLAQAEALCRAYAALEQKCLPLLQKTAKPSMRSWRRRLGTAVWRRGSPPSA
ncbi:MAG: hypothetical protein ACLS3C_05395 [Oscillospiraceae bacterium]